MDLFSNRYQGKKVLVTGHTGFKGSWLVFWLNKLGAEVYGISNQIITNPSHYELISPVVKSFMIDIRDKITLQNKIIEIQPDIIFHLAAQPLVRYSYKEPVETFETNMMGTVNVLASCLLLSNCKGIVVVTSDKCYENFEDDRPYNEDDRMGGYDPYSASKGAVELIVNSFRNSFFNTKDFNTKHNFIIASARAGNVIAGGDWSEDRLIPDLVKNYIKGKITVVRSPFSTRPWQHVLEPLSGYLLLGQKIIEGDVAVARGWNFGPENNDILTVKTVIEMASEVWNELKFDFPIMNNQLHEASLLRLDCTKANQLLNWYPVWGMNEVIQKTIYWYKDFYLNKQIRTELDLIEYIMAAKAKDIIWAR
ncbi:MAG: CDP-glucose 4,6-dehydratase [bacterium]|nr:CDP-glucose 4,6-dehydratase [bacterium]